MTFALLVFLTLPRARGEEDSTGPAFPYRNAKVVYRVKGKSPVGPIFGTLTYTVEEVSESSYTVTVEVSGNADKIPSFTNQESQELNKGDPISFSSLLEKSTLTEERTLKVKEREIQINEYYSESQKRFGKEVVSTFVPEELGVPLILNYTYGDRYRISVELTKTNIEYLQG